MTYKGSDRRVAAYPRRRSEWTDADYARVGREHLERGGPTAQPPPTPREAEFDLSAPEPGVMTAEEAARVLRVSAQTVRRECARGRLQHCRAGAQIRITHAQLEDYLIFRGEKRPDVDARAERTGRL